MNNTTCIKPKEGHEHIILLYLLYFLIINYIHILYTFYI